MLLRWKKRHNDHNEETSVLRRAGITLVETMVSVMLLMIMLAMVVGIVSPSFKVFIRMQKLQFARMILDNVVEDVQDTVREATTYVKIYGTDDDWTKQATNCIAGQNGTYESTAESGLTLEYVNTDGYVVLASTGGCQSTKLYRGKNLVDSSESVKKGRLLYRYYRKGDLNTETATAPNDGITSLANEYYYFNDDGDTPIARATTTAFGSGYYMGNYLKIEYSFPKNSSGNSIADDERVAYLNATASLYSDENLTDLVVSEEFVIDLRYQVVRENGITAVYGDGYFSESTSSTGGE